MKKATFNGPATFTPSPHVDVTNEQLSLVSMACSILLDDPGEDFLDRLTAVEAVLDRLPDEVTDEVAAFARTARSVGIRGLDTHYVAIFDQRRRCSLYLSYYAVGDTRQRGTAILAFGDALRSCGFNLARRELPDHLCVVLEAGATAADPTLLIALLSAHRDGIEVLRTALESAGSPYYHLIRTIAMVLPHMDEETTDRYLALVRKGPPAELVGISDIASPLPLSEVTKP